MLHRAPGLGRGREHLCGSHCLSMDGLTAWGAPAREWQVPSESVSVEGWQGPMVWERLLPCDYATAASGGRLNLASSRAILVPFSAASRAG